MDFKKDIILPSWKLIAQDSKVKKFYFLPGVLWILFLTLLLFYQVVYTYVVLAHKKSEAFSIILKFFEQDYFWEVVIVALIFLFLYIILTPIFEWALIKYISKKDAGEEKISSSDMFWVGLFNFFSIFEYDQMFSKFRLISILNFYLFTLRLLWTEYLNYISWTYFALLLFSILINIFFSYAKYEIVLWWKKVFESAGSSAKIAVLNLKTTIKLYFMIFLLNFRVIFNFIILLIFPFLMALAVGYFTTKIFATISIIILVILFVWLLLFVSYLSAVLEIFTTSLWYHAWKYWIKKVKDVEK